MNISIVLGRFQGVSLTTSHKEMLRKASESGDYLIVGLHSQFHKISKLNPLPVAYRKIMLEEALKTLQIKGEVLIFPEKKYSSRFLELLEKKVTHLFPKAKFTLYVKSGDNQYKDIPSFFNVKEIEVPNDVISFSDMRNMIMKSNTERRGPIYLAGFIDGATSGESYPIPRMIIVPYVRERRSIIVVKTSDDLDYSLIDCPLESNSYSLETEANRLLSLMFPGKTFGPSKYVSSFKGHHWSLRNTGEINLYFVFVVEVKEKNFSQTKTLFEDFALLELEDKELTGLSEEYKEIIKKLQ